MSVFKKIKGTFQIAQQDIVDGLRTLTSTDSQSRHNQHNSFTTREINLDVGAGLLYRYQNSWSIIQSETSKSAQKAEEASIMMAPMLKIWHQYAESATHLEQEVKDFSSILANLAKLQKLFENLRQDFIIAEKELDVLENVCDEKHFISSCLEERKKLATYKAKKVTEAEKLNVDLANKHAKKMAVIESEKKANLQERAEAFMSAFRDDVNYYHMHGHFNQSSTKRSTVSRLSSIELDQNNEALDSFLGTDEPGNLELSGEGSYIEDDYITDYSIKQDTDFLENEDYSSYAVIREMDIEEEKYIYQENQNTGYFYEQDVHNPQITPSDHRVNEDIVENIESTNDKAIASDVSQGGDGSQTSLEVGQSNEENLDTTNDTILITVTRTQNVNIIATEAPENDVIIVE